MKVLSSQEELLRSLLIASKALSTKTTLPILGCFLLETKDDELYCMATDLEIGIKIKIPGVTIISPGRIVAPGKTLLEIIRRLPPGRIEMALNDGERLFTIISAQSNFELHILPVEEFPPLPKGFEKLDPFSDDTTTSNDLILKMKSSLFRDAVRKCAYATLPEDSRPFLSSVLMEFEEGRLRLVATDINRLVIKDLNLKNKKEEKILVPVKALREIAQIFGNDPEEEIGIFLLERHLYAVGNGILLFSRLIDAQYPKYQPVIPTEFQGKATINRQVFLAALDRGSLMDKAVKLTLSQGNLHIHSSDPELGTAHEVAKCLYEGEEIEIGFNAQFIIDFLRVVEEEEVIFNISAGMKASLLEALGRDDYQYVIMPLRLSI